MTNSLDSDAIHARFLSEWSEAEPSVPVFWENAPDKAPPQGHWVRFKVAPGSKRRDSFTRGPTRHSTRGRIEVQVFAPRGAGTAERDRLGDVAGVIFDEWRSDDNAIECSGAEYSTPTPDETDAWSMRRVSIPYLSRRFA